MKILRMQPWHLVSVAMRLRAADLAQLQAFFSGPDQDPQIWACNTVLRSPVAYAISADDGMPIACIGATSDGDVADIWFAATDALTHSTRAQIMAKRIVEFIVDQCGYVMVTTRCLKSNPYSARTLDHLGFERCGTHPNFGGDGSDLLFFAKEGGKCASHIVM